MQQVEIQFAGFGGQGILLMGNILTQAAMEEGYEVLWVPSYGPEMRGGTAYCTVIISDKLIGSPVVKNPTHLVAMNLPSLEKFKNSVKAGGVVLVNASMIPAMCDRDDVDEVRVPIVELAKEAGNVKTANIVALAAFVERTKVVKMESLVKVVKDKFAAKPAMLPLNINALEAGQKAVMA